MISLEEYLGLIVESLECQAKERCDKVVQVLFMLPPEILLVCPLVFIPY